MLYDLAYSLLILGASPILLMRRWRQGKYREGRREKLFGRVPEREGNRPCAWFHAVSVGEVNLIVRLVAEFRAARPDWDIVVTSTTTTGRELARKRFPEALVSYGPLDFSWAVAETLRRWRPDLLVLVELELWPNLLEAADRRGVKVAVVNGRLSARSHRGYRRFRGIVASWLQRIDWVGASSPDYADRFADLGLPRERIDVTGSLKFDRAEFDRANPKTTALRQLARFAPSMPVWVAGSTQAGEEAIVLATFERLRRRFPDLRLVIVPRHQERFGEVAELLNRTSLVVERRSVWTDSSDETRTAPDIVLVDTIGELGAWWGLADVAFVGGSLGSRGGQNMIEPAAYGAAVCFGPETRNFRDVVQMLLESEGAEVVADGAALEAFVARCLTDPRFAQGLGERARQVVQRQQGATARTLERLVAIADAAAPTAPVRTRAAA
ncbi:MAG TPA: 3-deoxy-D-manno-octulosonic acid transferase [Pirellulaceae bacterium]|nr:3-deoxy-D-manno-octulosonic acid transferase [Pirellulaceae bacterium]